MEQSYKFIYMKESNPADALCKQVFAGFCQQIPEMLSGIKKGVSNEFYVYEY